ncbi:hypothetical protein AB0G79_27975 [Streptomyces sp. NPDC020807]|uniref:hypothetical protein n=1 Tax=Streptomyces sp. NPDC020807 TaxID=3155119 RepID=UPI0033F6D69E
MTSTTRATGRATARRRAAAGVLAACLVLALSACGGAAAPPAADKVLGEANPSGECPAVRADRTVDSIVSRTRPFGLPTLVEFARDDHVVNVISGTVTATRVQVMEPGASVVTILTVAVERQRETGRPTTVTVRENGGIATLAQVRSGFEGKGFPEPSEEELAETTAHRIDGIELSCVGERVLVVVADDTATQKKQGAYSSLVRLVRKGNSPTYTWPGKAPNPKWERTVDIESLM